MMNTRTLSISKKIQRIITAILVIGWFVLTGGSAAAESISGREPATGREFGYVGRTIKFQHLNYEQGLSNNNVWSVWQDSLGFMWFGTVGGLNRFDGYGFVTYKSVPGDETSLSGNLVSAVYEDAAGDLWVGTWEDGLNHFDRETETVTHYGFDLFDPRSIGSNSIRAILQDSLGTIWVGTAGGGLNRYDPAADAFIRYQHEDSAPNSLGSNDVFALFEDSLGNLWIGTFAGGLNRYDREGDKFWQYYAESDSEPNLSGALIDALAEDQDGNLWLGTWGSGLHRFDLETYQIAGFYHEPDDDTSLSNDFVLSLAVDNNGNLWAGTDGGGLNRLNPDGTFQIFSHHSGDDESLSNNVVRSLFVDREGTLWIGTWGGGVDRLSQTYNQFNHFKYSPDSQSGLSDSNVLSLYQDEEGIVWAGTETGGLNRLDLENGEVIVYQKGTDGDGTITSNSVRSILPSPKGELWIGTLGGGLNLFNPETETFSRVEFPAEVGCFDVYALASLRDVLWVGCSSGLVKYSFTNGTTQFYTYDPANSNSLSNGFVTDLLIAPDDTLWIGTFGGLNRLDLRTGVITRYVHDREDAGSISHNNITTLYLDSAGDLWVGTLAGGLNRFDEESETFASYYEVAQQVGDAVLGITEGGAPGSEEDLVLWLSTYQGLVKFSPEVGVLRVYDVADGLQGNTFNPSALYRNAAGEIMFGGTNGFNIFSSEDLISNFETPPIVITSLNLNLEPVPVNQDSLLKQSITTIDTLVLSYQEQLISFEFSALSYTAPEKNVYRYRLENFEDDWHTVSSERRFVSYTNLDPGEYVLRVTGANSDGVWNEEGVSLRLVIIPPWWETWWFTTFAIMAVVAAIVLSIRYRLKSLENQRSLLEELVVERTQEIKDASEKLSVLNQELEAFAYTVSHDLRAPLRAVNGYNTILLEDHAANLNEEGRDFIGRSLNAVERMDMMIDAVLELSRMTRHDLEKEPLNLSVLAQKHADELLEMDLGRVVTWRIHPDIEVIGDRRVVMVVLENLMGNAWKFTRKRRAAVIEVGEMLDNGRRVYFVRDNGVGFDARNADQVFALFQRSHPDEEYEGYGVGLAIVRRAVLKHGGKIWVESEIDQGTTFYFTL